MSKIINLLPKPKQSELRYERILKGMTGVVVISLVLFALVFVVQFGAKIYLHTEAAATQNQITQLKEQVNKNDNAALKQQIKTVNDTVSDFTGLANSAPRWSKVLKAFAPLPPDTVGINSFSVDAKTKIVSINGFSPTREAVIELYNNLLKDSDHFTNVDYPLENISQSNNINFHFTFNVADSLLH